MGRLLSETVGSIPYLDKDQFERLFNDRLQELLLVLYLAKLVKAQIAMGDKLGMSAPPPQQQ